MRRKTVEKRHMQVGGNKRGVETRFNVLFLAAVAEDYSDINELADDEVTAKIGYLI